jgi:prepilin-type N-terminal cleavage/methylation domain-containing protein
MRIRRLQGGRTGFTMVEVLVVVVVIGILSAIAVPKFLSSQGAKELEATGATLYQDLEWARLQAVTTQKRHYVVFDSSARSWTIYRENGGNLAYDAGSETQVRTHIMGIGVRFGFGSNFSSLPGSLSATNGFASTDVARSGRGAGFATTDDCVEGATSGSGSWSSTVTICVGRGVRDIETGVVYLSSKRSSSLAVAVLYNDKGTSPSLQLQRWIWQGSWRRA